jgi:pimeloyl-ACP methyl ester carboxylesterase
MSVRKFIQNRKGQKIVVLLEQVEDARGLVFVVHGLGGSKEQPVIEVCAKVFSDFGYDVLRFDMINSFGESDGKYEDATTTGYYEDLEDVIVWSKKQEWFQCPFFLVGHSLGGMVIGLYAEKFPDQIKALIPISTVVSGSLSVENDPDLMREWKETGWLVSERKSQPGTYKKLPWSHMEDRKKYNLLDGAENLKMPVLLIVGEKDYKTPVGHHKILYEALPGSKELKIIKGADHVFSQKSYLDEIDCVLADWEKRLDSLREINL